MRGKQGVYTYNYRPYYINFIVQQLFNIIINKKKICLTNSVLCVNFRYLVKNNTIFIIFGK